MIVQVVKSKAPIQLMSLTWKGFEKYTEWLNLSYVDVLGYFVTFGVNFGW